MPPRSDSIHIEREMEKTMPLPTVLKIILLISAVLSGLICYAEIDFMNNWDYQAKYLINTECPVFNCLTTAQYYEQKPGQKELTMIETEKQLNISFSTRGRTYNFFVRQSFIVCPEKVECWYYDSLYLDRRSYGVGHHIHKKYSTTDYIMTILLTIILTFFGVGTLALFCPC